ncbi:hypothetical protein J6590_018119 [Homalodisca vitripennis]|nr:hypothetical protein J6590_018119 [Homalodisca vitripennis]
MKEELFKFLHGLLALAVLLAPQDSECLKLIKVKVPAYKLKGETAVLQCVYEMEGLEKLYTVKWYRENEEFYRYVPKYKPSQISYKVEGIRVDHQMSDDTKVTLKSVSLKTTANYRCEVSAEAPSFASVQGSGRLEVVSAILLKSKDKDQSYVEFRDMTSKNVVKEVMRKWMDRRKRCHFVFYVKNNNMVLPLTKRILCIESQDLSIKTSITDWEMDGQCHAFKKVF